MQVWRQSNYRQYNSTVMGTRGMRAYIDVGKGPGVVSKFTGAMLDKSNFASERRFERLIDGTHVPRTRGVPLNISSSALYEPEGMFYFPWWLSFLMGNFYIF
jgi:hypothetical protein